MTYEISSTGPEATLALGVALGEILEGGEVIELIGDLGVGKTQFVRGLAKGVQSEDVVQSPSFTISRIYKGEKFSIYHYDFYRLGVDVGMMRAELDEQIGQPDVVVITEWANTVSDVLTTDRLQVNISYGPRDDARQIKFVALGSGSAKILEQLK